MAWSYSFCYSITRLEAWMRIGVLQLDDVRLGFEYREGSGIPIVFMGGVTSTTATWAPVLDRLETSRPIYLLDHRGHGRSSHIESGDYANWVGQVSDTCQFLERVSGRSVVVGHSQGGIQAFYAAGQKPQLVAGLYSEDIAPHFVAKKRHVGSAFIGALKKIGVELGKALDADEKGSEMAARIAGVSLGGDITFGDVRSDEQLQIMADGVLQMDPKIFTTFFEDDSLPPFDLDETIRAIQCPMHFAYGVPELGGLFVETDLDDFRDKGCDLTSTNFENVGHSVHFDVLEPFVEDLAAFLDRVD